MKRESRYLSADEVSEICRRYVDGETGVVLGADFGVSHNAIYYVLRRNGIARRSTGVKGPTNANWKGGRRKTTAGYVDIYVEPDDEIGQAMMLRSGFPYLKEHRLVYAHHLGRPLRDDESVHHINGVKNDNRLENLQLRSRAHGAGQARQCLDCGSHNVSAVPLAG